LLKEVESSLVFVAQQLEEARFQNALKHAMGVASSVNVYLGAEQPWKTIKSDRERAATVLYVGLRCVDNLKTMLTPFLPFSSQRLHAMLGYEDVIAPQPEVREVGDHRVITGEYGHEDRWQPSQLEPGRKLPEPERLFKLLEEVAD
jgi:methionyl-tRNA synthetase